MLLLLENRIRVLEYLLHLFGCKSGFLYLNSVTITQGHLKQLDRFFPLNLTNVVRLGLSIGLLLGYPITSSRKLQTFLEYVSTTLNECRVAQPQLEELLTGLSDALLEDSREKKLRGSRSIGDFNRLLGMKHEKTIKKSRSLMKLTLRLLRMKSQTLLEKPPSLPPSTMLYHKNSFAIEIPMDNVSALLNLLKMLVQLLEKVQACVQDQGEASSVLTASLYLSRDNVLDSSLNSCDALLREVDLKLYKEVYSPVFEALDALASAVLLAEKNTLTHLENYP